MASERQGQPKLASVQASRNLWCFWSRGVPLEWYCLYQFSQFDILILRKSIHTVKIMEYVYRPIGVIRSPHRTPEDTPVQPVFAEGIEGQVEVFREFEKGLSDLQGFSHIYLIYPFDRTEAARLLVTPYLDDTPRGVFSTRAPCRPNALGISLVRLVRREGPVLHIEDVDILDGTPLFDIKPYVSRFDVRASARCGWQDEIDDEIAKQRGRRGLQSASRKEE